MKHRIAWSVLAKTDLLNILLYVQKDGVGTGLGLVKLIRSETSKLKYFPFLGRMVLELTGDKSDQFRELIVSRYRVIYSVGANTVQVQTIVDQSQDLETQFLKRLKP